ncbi:exodeoxyribonuclease V beta subunit [Methylomarinovum caldicuralii]|uniref:RecBCD enzyme subunit RecB n=1 Tax=Methylomarinovum caldicuralii TaxID=438856 RepID=A0AAU9BYQ5_9GAMM|nr:UvrD-helicase domain-containing protein [Methylomarinovum caldicuralii]BCX81445.1 exodeoxyribonuclease V beta subunit [Methylomarinovum caldicuralii]
MQSLDLYGADFARGVHLIEASAGTGKTYSIAQLVARFVVAEGISVEEIGVVTFTKAATAELRQRIQQRLCQVRDALQGADPKDDALRQWLAGLEDPDQACRRVEAELLRLDLMPIQTIHSFCQHALRQQALEAGELLGQALLEDDRPFNQAIVDDYWRQCLRQLTPAQWRAVLQRTASPDRLLECIARWQPPVTFVPEVPWPEDAPVAVTPGAWQAFRGWMDDLCAKGCFNKPVRLWWAGLRDEAKRPQQLGGAKLRADLAEFLEAHLSKRKVKPPRLTSLPDYAAHEPVLLALAELGRRQTLLGVAWLQRAWRHWQEQYEKRLREQGLLTHDWVVRRLADVVAAAPIEALSRRFQVFLIDEFQDTDRHQWRIFSSLFGAGRHWLFLIGDPKQSIYRFRGADLDTYFQAAAGATERWYLDTNYRSHPDLVAAVNEVFADCDGADPERRPFYHPLLHYPEVKAGRSAADLALNREGGAPLVWQAFEADGGGPYRYTNKDDTVAQLARHVAADVVELLQQARLVEKGRARRLRPGDIAVLVRDNEEARIVRDALRDSRVPAVLIDRRSVFVTDTAEQLYRLLETLWEGVAWRRVKRVLADGWFGLDAGGLTELERDEGAASAYLEAFAEAAARWREDSLLAALEALFRRFGVWEAIARRRDGLRTLADLRHLLEMLQEEASRRQLGPQALLGWYRRRLDRPAGEAEQLRLESDDDAVELVTMHSAKGLEYPVVLCFDLWAPESDSKHDPTVVGDASGSRVVFQIDGDAFAAAHQERLTAERQEALRIAYVALTRAKAGCWVYLLERENGPWSALRHLLTYRGEPDPFLEARRLAREFPRCFQYRRRPWRLDAAPRWRPQADRPRLVAPEPPARDLSAEALRLTSYSALVRGRDHGAVTDWLERLLEEGLAEPRQQLPRGVAFGNLLHWLLEKVPFRELAAGRIDPALWTAAQRWSGVGEMLEPDEVLPLLQGAVTTPLPPFSLADVPPERRLHELEFFLPLRRLEAGPINRLLKGQPWYHPLRFAPVSGFLRGFIDLVAECDGRFYVIDYKSNELAAYDEATLAEAMRSHDYGLQALLYALALHRYLKTRLRDYDYRRHFGGVRYLFLRGMDGTPGRGVYGFVPAPDWIDTLEAMLTP